MYPYRGYLHAGQEASNVKSTGFWACWKHICSSSDSEQGWNIHQLARRASGRPSRLKLCSEIEKSFTNSEPIWPSDQILYPGKESNLSSGEVKACEKAENLTAENQIHGSPGQYRPGYFKMCAIIRCMKCKEQITQICRSGLQSTNICPNGTEKYDK